MKRASIFIGLLIASVGAIQAGIHLVVSGEINKRLIVCIGINQYSGDEHPLGYAVKDAKDACAELQKHETKAYDRTRTILLLDREATRDAILKAVAAPEDTALTVFFAGQALVNGGDSIIIPYQKEFRLKSGERINGRDLAAAACKAGRIRLLFDTEKTPLFFRQFASACRERSIQALGASLMDQGAAEGPGNDKFRESGGVFTRGLLAVLRARKSPEVRIDLAEIYASVRDEVSARASQGDMAQFPSLFYADEATAGDEESNR